MKIPSQNNGRKGFTLVEILIAMGIFMVIIMAIVASIFFLLADSVINWGVGLLLGLGR